MSAPDSLQNAALGAAMAAALAEARRYAGATAPNPPVGAAALDERGQILGVAAHERAGTPHAEARLLALGREQGWLARARTLVVTLEPCNHHGRTPPCTEAILATPSIRRVAYAVADPNPQVQGGGHTRLASAGLDVIALSSREARELLAPFAFRCRTGRPFVTVKQALRHDESGQLTMIPQPGAKTFTSSESLHFAHELRRECDAIITGSGTILADQPSFTVRRVPDHPGKNRWLVILDRRGRVPKDYLKTAESRGFIPSIAVSPVEALIRLGKEGALHVLVEAGPTLTETFLKGSWNDAANYRLCQRHVIITHHPGRPDRIETRWDVEP